MKKLIFIIMLILFFSSISVSQNLDSGLVGKWLFSGNALDSSGNGNYGTLMNGVLFTTDRYGRENCAALFDGIDDFIWLQYLSALNGLSKFTFSYWIYFNPNGFGSSGYVFSHWKHDGQYGGPIGFTTGLMPSRNAGVWFTGGQSTWSNSGIIDSLNWNNIVITFDGTKPSANRVSLYKNGNFIQYLSNSSDIPVAIGTQATRSYIGAACGPNGSYNAWAFYKGKLDDMIIWNRTLTQVEISLLYGNYFPNYPNLISPANSSTNISTTPTLNWNAVSGATGYKVKISLDSTFNIVVDSASTSNNQYTVPSGKLGSGIKYYWKVAGYNQNGIGAYSAIWNFRTLYNSSLDSGLVGKWLFTGNALDSSGNGNHGTVYGATLTSDRYGNPNSAYSFNGSNNYIEIPDNINFRPPNITCVVWIYGNFLSSAYKAILSKNAGTATFESIGMFASPYGTIRAGIGGPNFHGAHLYSQAPPINEWLMLTYVFDDTKDSNQLYINGVLATKGSEPSNIIYDNKPWSIGAQLENNSYGFFVNGRIDDIRIYNRPLTASEIMTLYIGVPTAPPLLSPLNNSTELPLTPTLVWSLVNNTSGYRVKVSTDSTFTTIVDSANVLLQMELDKLNH